MPSPHTMAADFANAIALGAPEKASKWTGSVMKMLSRMNMTLTMKITG